MSQHTRILAWHPIALVGTFLAVSAGIVFLLTGCTTAPVAAPSATTATVSASPAPAPELHPDGTAAENLPLFASVVDQVWASANKAQTAAYVDALAAAGFAKADMQATADTSTVGNPAESIQFSVRWGANDCLIGQVGPSTGSPVTTVMAQLAGGRCLIGATPDLNGDQ